MKSATKPQPVLIVMSVMAGLTALVGGLAAISEVPRVVVAVAALIVGAVNVGMAYFLRGLVVPLVDTAAYLDEDRQLIAGPAAAVTTGKPAEVIEERGLPPAEPAVDHNA